MNTAQLQLQQTLEGHLQRTWHASWAPDGLKIASCGEDKTIRIWAWLSGTFQCLATIDEGQTRTIRSCEWSCDGQMIASASFDGTVLVWRTRDNSFQKWDRIGSLEGHDNEVKSVAWSNDDNFLATCGRDKKIWVWERLQGNNDFECAGVLDGHTQDVKFVIWHPSSFVLFSASYDDTIKVWAEDSGDWYCCQTLVGHSSTVWGLTFDRKGNQLISCSDDRTVFLWQCDSISDPTKQWRRVMVVRDLHRHAIYSLDWNVTYNIIATGAGDNAIALLRYEKSEDGVSGLGQLSLITKVENAHDGDVNCVRWNPRYDPTLAPLLLSAGDDGLVKIWRLEISE